MAEGGSSTYAATVEAVETAYEYMLAYAAQGRDSDAAGGGSPIRAQLEKLRSGLDRLVDVARREAAALGADGAALEPFLGVLAADIAAAAPKVALALSARAISSQLIDNLNASIHVRAVLTDLFLLDEFVKSLRRKA